MNSIALSTNSTNPRTISRIAAVQTLYAYIISMEDIKEIIHYIKYLYQNNHNLLFENNPYSKIELISKYFKSLVMNTVDHESTIDQVIKKHLKNDITQLHKILLVILRLGTCEILYFNTPNQVIIHEFTTIASEFVDTHEIGFVNSILDSISNDNKK